MPGGLALAALAVLGHMIHRFRSGGAEFSIFDAVIVTLAVTILGASAIPLVETTSQQAKNSSLLQGLHTLRSQIELYKLEHGGKPPLLYEGSFPQLIRATDAAGTPGVSGKKFPHGPYLRRGVPMNPITGRSVVTATDIFPPTEPSGNGGWFYHQETGRIAPDLKGYLDR